jgi:sugar transferase (PEP-CTERM/EpsH1 system associated)
MSAHRLRILYLVLEMDLGGLQRIVNLLIQRIDKRIYEPYLCCLNRGGLFYEQASSCSAGSFTLNRQPGPFDSKLFRELYSILREKKIDIIHSHNGCSSYAALAGRLARVKGIIHTDHGRLVPDRKAAIIEDRVSALMIDRFVGVSQELTEYLATTVKVSRKKLMTIINGVDINKFKPLIHVERNVLRRKLGFTESDKIIGTVCRLDPIKNLNFLISCIPAITESVSETRLVIVGDGSIRESLITYVKTLGLGSRIVFLGQKEEIEKILPIFDIYACTSLSEGTSMTILEAMSCGLPIVASAVGGNVRLVDGSNGIVFPLNDAASFTEAVASLLSEPAVRSKKGRRSREKVEGDFSVERMVRQYEELYISTQSEKKESKMTVS